MSFTYNKSIWFVTVISCGLASSACGAAPDGMDTAGTDEIDTASSALCHGDDCPEPPIPDPDPNPGPAPQLSTFRLHVQGIEITGICESGWEGNVAEVYWSITAHYGQVPLSFRASSNPVNVSSDPTTGFPGWIPMNVTKELKYPIGDSMHIDANAWEKDDFLEGEDDWLGHVSRDVSPNELTQGANREFGEYSKGGNEGCQFKFWYDVTLN